MQIIVQDHNAIGVVFQDGGKTAAVLIYLLVQLRIVDGDSSLVGKALQDLKVIRRGRASVTAEHDEHPQRLPGNYQWEIDKLAQPTIQRHDDLPQFMVQQIKVGVAAYALKQVAKLLIEDRNQV